MSGLAALMDRYRVDAEPLRSERRLELLLLIAVAVVVLQLLWLSYRWFADVSVEPVPPASDSLAVMQPASPGAITAIESRQLQARPLFWASREPLGGLVPLMMLDTDGEASGATAPRLEKLQLTGVFGGGTTGGAILSYQGQRMRLLVDQELDGWTLQRVGPGVAVFVSGGISDERTLMSVPVAVLEAVNDVDAGAASPASEDASDSGQAEKQARAATPAQDGKAPREPVKRGLSLGGR